MFLADFVVLLVPGDGILVMLGGGFVGGDVIEILGGDGFANFVGGFVGLIVGLGRIVLYKLTAC